MLYCEIALFAILRRLRDLKSERSELPDLVLPKLPEPELLGPTSELPWPNLCIPLISGQMLSNLLTGGTAYTNATAPLVNLKY